MQKKIAFNSGEAPEVWNFSYPSYNGVTEGTTTVAGPEYSASFTHFGYASNAPWKIGLIKNWSYGDGSYSETYAWAYQQISNQTWSVLGVSMGTVKAPVLSSVETNRAGDATLKIEYLYQRLGTKRYGLPTRVNYYVNGSGVLKYYLELQYYYEDPTRISTWRDTYYMLDYLYSEITRDGNGQMMAKTLTNYYDEAGKRGAIDSLVRYKNETEFYTWDYGYDSDSPNLVTISVKEPFGPTISYKFSYGVKNEVSDGSNQLIRNISEFNSAIKSETNQHGGTVGYTYDDAGRIIKVNRPDPFNDTDYLWHDTEKRLEISQGGYTVNKYWDGIGRDIGFIQTGANLVLYYMKELDAEGRLISESNGGTNPDQKYSYQYDNSGRITRITNPLGKFTEVHFSGRRKTIVDANNRSTFYDYDDFPGLPTKVTDAKGNQAFHTYDPLGRLINVNHVGIHDGTRIHTYQYDWLGRLISQSHPETGSISYAFNPSGRLVQETWGNSRKNYSYSDSRLTSVETYKPYPALEERISYQYDDAGRISCVSSSKGWSRKNITYNIWGAITSETLSIQGLSDKATSYQYDSNNLLSSITYPSGRVATTTYNDLNLPFSLTFNSKPIIDEITYGQQGLPASISIAGNDTTYYANYLSPGYLAEESLKRGGTTLYETTYSYDNVGNISNINVTGEAPIAALEANFNYDELYRLINASYSTGRVNNYAYEYDDFGNMRNVFEGPSKVFEKDYDSQNRIIGFSYDDRGNLTYANGKFFLWDSFNRLQSIQNSSGELLGQYTYDDRGLRLKAVPPMPEIHVKQGESSVPDGGTIVFYAVSGSDEKVFTVYNQGYLNLSLGNITISGSNADQFQVTQQPGSVVSPGSSTTFKVKFQLTSQGLKIAELQLSNNDLDENPYTIILKGNYAPEIDIPYFPNGSSYDFGTVNIGDFMRISFRIRNLAEEGSAALELPGSPHVEILGPDCHNFTIEQQPTSPIAPGQYTDFIVQFTPYFGVGPKEAYLSISNNDPDENPYIIYLYGTAGEVGPQKVIETEDKNQISIKSPEGSDEILGNTFQTITWRVDDNVNFVRIEYSTDNGSTYKIITERAPNTGQYDWLTPSEISSSCLIRITDADTLIPVTAAISIEFSFKIPRPKVLFQSPPQFSSLLAVPDSRRQAYLNLELKFSPYEAQRLFQISGNDAWTKPIGYETFLDRWYRLRVEFDLDTSMASIWLDGNLILENVGLRLEPVTIMRRSPGMITYSVEGEPDSMVFIDDLEVKIQDHETKYNVEKKILNRFWQRLFIEDFEGYESENELKKSGGWAGLQRQRGVAEAIYPSDYSGRVRMLMKAYQEARDEKAMKKASSILQPEYFEASSGLKSMKLSTTKTADTEAMRIFSLPEGLPFAISQRSFKVTDRLGASESIRDKIKTKRNESRLRDYFVPDSGSSGSTTVDKTKTTGGAVADGGSGGSGAIRTMSVGIVGIYYVYSFDGRLLAEYDGYGVCLREYVYIGAKMVAEYQPLDNKYYYYTTDLINSTRVVTNDLGNVVYAAAHDPYGAMQQTWTNAFNPELKYSGKEKDAESGLYYFGARYYDPTLYRFLSPDPVIPAEDSLYSPERWNLYVYCYDNPLVYLDPDGGEADYFVIKIKITRTFSGPNGTFGILEIGNKMIGYTIEPPQLGNLEYISCIPEGTYSLGFFMSPKFKMLVLRITSTIEGNRTNIEFHPGNSIEDTEGCPVPVKRLTGGGEGYGSREAFNDLMSYTAAYYIFLRYMRFWYGPTPQIELRIGRGEVYTEITQERVYDENGNLVWFWFWPYAF